MRSRCLLYLAIILLLSSFNAQAQLQWKWQNPKPQGNDLNSIHALSATTIVAVGEAGTVIRTTDGGTTWSWTKCAGGRCATLYDVHFPTSVHGYAVGDEGVILKSTNAGATWLPQTSGKTSTLYGVAFLNKDTGIVVGDAGVILKTVNGGSSWTQQTSGTTTKLFEITFKSSTLAVAAGDSNKIIKSTNLGASWVKKNISNRGFNSGVAFSTTSNGYVVGLDTCTSGIFAGSRIRFQRTSDGGETWTTDTTGTCLAPFLGASKRYGVAMPGTTTSFVVGTSGRVWRQTAFSGDWWSQTSNTTLGLVGVHFYNTSIGFAVGSYGVILKTINAGATWTEISTAFTRNPIYAVDYYDAKNGFVVGNLGTDAYRTSNGGTNWLQTTLPSSYILNDVEMLNNYNAIAVGNGGVIAAYTGVWLTKTSGTTKTLRGVSFINPYEGWAVGDSGEVRHTYNSGTTWAQQFPGTVANLYGVKFIDTSYGWAVGASGTIIRSTTGGSTWTSQTSGTTQLLYSVDFTDRNYGTAVGANGVILRTSNSGINWIPQTSNITSSISGVSFTNRNYGLCVASSGYILFTSNGGTTWLRDSCETTNQLFGISYVNNCGTAVGIGGTILRTDSGYFNIPPPGTHDYGSVIRSNHRPDTLRYYNTGHSDLVISSVASDNAQFALSSVGTYKLFSPDTAGWLVPPDSVFKLVVTFTPLTVGVKTGHIIFTNNASGSPETLTVTGTGIEEGVPPSGFTFGYPTGHFPPSYCFPARHKDVVAMVMIAPVTGTLDSFHFQMCNIGALNDIVKVRIFKSSVGPRSGPGHGGYANCIPWGYFPNTFDADQALGAFTDDATGSWISTTGSSPASFPLQGNEIWGLGGYSIIATPNAVNNIDLSDIESVPTVTKGDSLLVTIRVNGPSGHVNDSLTEFASYVFPGDACRDTLTQVFKFYEHNEPTSLCPSVPSIHGWRTICDGNTLGGLVFNWWFSMTPSSSAPPTIEEFTKLGDVSSSGPQTIQATVYGSGITTVCIVPCCDGQFPVTCMTQTAASTFEGSLPGQPPGTTVCYQIVATDSSGRTSTSASVQYTVISFSTPDYSVSFGNIGVRNNIAATGTAIASSRFFYSSGNYDGAVQPLDNGTAGPYDLGGPFVFFGHDSMRYAWIGIDGALGLSKSITDTQHVNIHGLHWDPSAYPRLDEDMPKNFIAPLYSDYYYDSSGSGQIFIQADSLTHPGNVLFTVQWNNMASRTWYSMAERDMKGSVRNLNTSSGSTFRAILNRNAGTIEFQYDKLPANLSQSALATGSAKGFTGMYRDGRPDTCCLQPLTINSDGSPAESKPDTAISIKMCPVKTLSYCRRWNLASLPVIPCSGIYDKSSLFTKANSPAYAFCDPGYYCVRNTLTIGEGFWLKYDSATTEKILGEEITDLAIPLAARWNLIGSISKPAPVSMITKNTPNAHLSPFYGYSCSGGYIPVTVIEPGKGYWVKPDTIVAITLHSASFAKSGQPQSFNLEAMKKLTIQDATGSNQALYLCAESMLSVPLSDFELPPVSFDGMFGARFASGRMVETYPAVLDGNHSSGYTILLQNAEYPIRISFNVTGADGNSFVLTDQEQGKYMGKIILNNGETVTISNPAVTRILLTIVEGRNVPAVFALEQNYPNPFNPLTVIHYSLPVNSHVTLTIYDVLGREIASPVNGMQDAGFKAQEFDASELSSGVYFYRLHAVSMLDSKNSFTQVRKMLLVR